MHRVYAYLYCTPLVSLSSHVHRFRSLLSSTNPSAQSNREALPCA